jgi:hypothetical protein
LSASELLSDLPAFGSLTGAGNADQAQSTHFIENNQYDAPTMNAFVDDSPIGTEASSSVSFGDALSEAPQTSLIPPQPVAQPIPPMRIDTSFMVPELVLAPVDLSTLRERNPQVQLTPDQWRVFALIDGQNSLQVLCQMLMAPSDQICTLAGELMAIGLVTPLTPVVGMTGEYMPSGRDYSVTGMTPGPTYQPGMSMASGTPWPQQSQPGMMSQVGYPLDTRSQWGNGNNSPAFMSGNNWMLNARQGTVQPGQSGTAYAPAGYYR